MRNGTAVVIAGYWRKESLPPLLHPPVLSERLPGEGSFQVSLLFRKLVVDVDDMTVADSGGWRSAFRTDVDHDSEVIPISVPN